MLMCLWRNKRGLIPINQLIDLVMRQVSVWHSRLELCHYVQPGKAGSLNEDVSDGGMIYRVCVRVLHVRLRVDLLERLL